MDNHSVTAKAYTMTIDLYMLGTAGALMVACTARAKVEVRAPSLAYRTSRRIRSRQMRMDRTWISGMMTML